jgi:cell shape-determining protein MreC
LPVGTVAQVKPGGQYKQIRVRPSANLEKLEEVIVLLTTDPLVLKQDTPAPAGQSSVAPANAAAQPTSAATTAKPSDKRP